MQEFIDNVIPMHVIELQIIKQEIKKALEKEKEQMLNFYMWMRMNESAEQYFHYSDEDMFTEYLNQNQ